MSELHVRLEPKNAAYVKRAAKRHKRSFNAEANFVIEEYAKIPDIDGLLTPTKPKAR